MAVVRALLTPALLVGLCLTANQLLGKIFFKDLRSRKQDSDPAENLQQVWTGLGFVILLLPSANFLTPLANGGFLAVIFGASILGLIIFVRREFRNLLVGCWRWKSGLVISVASLIFSSRYFSAISQAVENYDSFLYHFTRIEYFKSEKIIFGLGNLHTRLGFPSNHFALSALVEGVSGLGSEGFRLLNPMLLLLVLITIVSSIVRVSEKLKKQEIESSFALTASLVRVVALSIVVVQFSNASKWLTPPSPDFAAAVFLVMAFSALIEILESADNNSVIFATVMTVTAWAYRPTAGVLLIGLIIGIVSQRRRGKFLIFRRRDLAASVSILVGLQLLVSLATTGALFYPSPLKIAVARYLPFHVPWDLHVNEMKWIESWAKSPGASPDEVLGNWDWFSPWWEGISGSLTDELWIFILLALARLIFGARLNHLSWERAVLPTVCVVTMFAAWIILAPTIRFGAGAIALLATFPLAATPIFITRNSGLDSKTPSASSRMLAAVAIVTCVGTLGPALVNPLTPLSTIRDLGHGLQNINDGLETAVWPTFPYRTSGDFDLRVPPTGKDACGRELWCLPYPNENLQIEERYGYIVVTID